MNCPVDLSVNLNLNLKRLFKPPVGYSWTTQTPEHSKSPPPPDEVIPPIAQQPEARRKNMSSGTTSTYWRVGALYGAAGVCLGAFGAHGLKSRISDPAKIASWGTAAQYQIIHSIALLVARDNPVAAGFFTAGMTMFSGSIYALILDPRFKFLGPVTPLGGLCLIGGWLALAFGKPSVAAGELRL